VIGVDGEGGGAKGEVDRGHQNARARGDGLVD